MFLPPIPQGFVSCVEADLDRDGAGWWDAAWSRISAGERAGAERFHRRRDALQHVVGRALARVLLARELGMPALTEEFQTTPRGKPLLPDSGLEFSISHSGSIVWTAVSRGGAVGIDAERVNPATDHHDLAGFFHPVECRAIRSLPATAAREAFYRCWTRKEAVAKAVGAGLSLPLQVFRVLTGTAAAGWLAEPPAPSSNGWTCSDLPTKTGYHASVVVMSADFTITAHRV